MVETILVPMDGSPLSKRALETAVTEHPDAEIHVLHVIDPSEPGYSYPIDIDPDVEPVHGSSEWVTRGEELAESLFDESRELAAEHGAELTTVTRVGRPDREIVDYVEEVGIDHIYLGSHGRGADARILLGSVTEAVAFRSPVRVSIIR